MVFIRRASDLALAIPLLLACGGGDPSTQPEHSGAAEHRQAGAGQEEEAEHHEAQYDPTQVQQEAVPNSEFWYGLDVYNPTEIHLQQAEEARTLAEQHRAAAASLESYEEQECARFPAETRASCPILGQVATVTDVPGGVRLEVKEGVRGDAVADHMRCHVAYAATEGREDMDRCPLYVQGANVESDDAIVLTTDAGDEAVAGLRRRARLHVDDGHDHDH